MAHSVSRYRSAYVESLEAGEKQGIKKGHVNYTGVDDFDDKHTLEAPDLWRWLLAQGIGDNKTVLLWAGAA